MKRKRFLRWLVYLMAITVVYFWLASSTTLFINLFPKLRAKLGI